MKYENRIVKASLAAGLSECLLGVIALWAGFGYWWFEHVGMFGYLGIGMVLYSIWHYIFIKIDNKKSRRNK